MGLFPPGRALVAGHGEMWHNGSHKCRCWMAAGSGEWDSMKEDGYYSRGCTCRDKFVMNSFFYQQP